MNVQPRAMVFNTEDVRQRIREAVASGNIRQIARQAKVAPNTIYGFIDPDKPSDPHGETVGKLGRWLDGHGEPEDYWRGVSYAAQAMAETVARLLAEMNGVARRPVHPDAAKVTQAATTAPVRSRQKAESPRPEIDQATPNTARLRTGSDSE